MSRVRPSRIDAAIVVITSVNAGSILHAAILSGGPLLWAAFVLNAAVAALLANFIIPPQVHQKEKAA